MISYILDWYHERGLVKKEAGMIECEDIVYLIKEDYYFPKPASAQKRMPLLRVAHEIWQTGSHYRESGQDVVSLMLIRGGRGTWRLNEATGPIAAGLLLAYGLGNRCEITITDDMEMHLLCLKGEEAELLVTKHGVQPPMAVPMGQVNDVCRTIIQDILRCSLSDNVHKGKIADAYLRVWAAWYETAATPLHAANRRDKPTLVTRALQYIDANISRLSELDSVARYCGCSREHLCRAFKQETAQTMWNYIRKKQMELAGEILRHSNATIDELARRFYYSDRFAFTKAFKHYLGVTPGDFRLQNMRLK